MHAEFYKRLVLSSSMRVIHTVSVRRTRLNVLVLLTLALTGESPTTVVSFTRVHTPLNTRDRSITRIRVCVCVFFTLNRSSKVRVRVRVRQLAKLSFDQNTFFFWSISQLKK